MRDPIAHTLKRLADASEMTLRKVLPEGSAMFRVAKRTYYAYAGRQAIQSARRIGGS
jgi:hypothetical protein